MIRLYIIMANLIITAITSMLAVLGYAVYYEDPTPKDKLVDGILQIIMLILPVYTIGFTAYLSIFTRHVTRQEFRDSWQRFRQGPIL